MLLSLKFESIKLGSKYKRYMKLLAHDTGSEKIFGSIFLLADFLLYLLHGINGDKKLPVKL
jgi:hypothetical protein